MKGGQVQRGGQDGKGGKGGKGEKGGKVGKGRENGKRGRREFSGNLLKIYYLLMNTNEYNYESDVNDSIYKSQSLK